MAGCIDCNMLGCIACDPILGFLLDNSTSECVCHFGYYISPMSICAQCKIEGCLDCDTAATCVICDNSTYYLDNSTKTCL